MLWFIHANEAALYEPLNSLMRRQALGRTALFRIMEKADWILAAELSLVGRFLHVPKLLFHRSWWPDVMDDRQRLYARLHPNRQQELPMSTWRLLRVLISIIREAPLRPGQRARSCATALRFCAKEARTRCFGKLTRLRRGRLGLTRQRLRRLTGRRP
jgi:hypothetical protein